MVIESKPAARLAKPFVISHKIQNRVQSADAEKLMGGNRNALVS